MSDKIVNAQQCPSDEVLEDFYCFHEDKDVENHVENCRKCRERLASFSKIDEMVSDLIAPPDGLADRIKAAVHNGDAESIAPFPWWRNKIWSTLASAAAVLVIVFSIAVSLAPEQSQSNSENTIATAKNNSTNTISDSGNFQVSHQTKSIKPENKDLPKTLALQTVLPDNYSRTRLVGINEKKHLSPPSQIDLEYSIPAKVRHVWTVNNVESAKNLLTQYAKLNGKIIDKSNQHNGKNDVVMVLTDTELQDLVDKLFQEKWSLLSPDLPQPNKKDKMRFFNKPVEYTLNIVPQKK